MLCSPVHGKALWNKKWWSSTQGPEQPYKPKVSLKKVQTCSNSCTHPAHSWQKSMVCPHGTLLLRVTGGLGNVDSAVQQAHTHTAQALKWATWLRLQAAQIVVEMLQKHIVLNHFCEETTVGADCTWTITRAWISNVVLGFFYIGQFTSEWRGCKTFCADGFLHLYKTFQQGTVQQRIQPKDYLM